MCLKICNAHDKACARSSVRVCVQFAFESGGCMWLSHFSREGRASNPDARLLTDRTNL